MSESGFLPLEVGGSVEQAVFEQRAWLQVALSSMGDGVLATDPEGRVTYLNPVAEALTGWPIADAAGEDVETVFRIVNEITRAPVEQPVRRVLASAGVVGLANHTILVARDGTERNIDDSASPIKDAQGRILGVILIFRDITERRRAEEIKARLANQVALVADVGIAFAGGASLFAMLETSTETVVRRLNAALARVWLLCETDNVLELRASAGLYTHLDGPHGRIAVGADKIGRIAELREPHFTNDVQNDQRVSDQEWAKREGMRAFAGYPLVVGDRLIGVVAVFARHSLADDTLLTLGSVADVIALGIDRKLREEALRKSEEFNRRIIESSPDCMKILDLEGRLLSLNDVGCRLLELDHFASRKNHLWDTFWPEEMRETAKAAVAKAKAGGRAEFQGPCRTAKGTEKWWDVSVVPILDAEDKPERLLCILRDITQAKRAEEQREAQTEALQRADRRKNEFLAMLAHELRNPLSAVKNAVQVLRHPNAQEHIEWAGDVIDRQVNHLVRLIEDLLDVSRITQGKLQLRKERCELRAVVNRVVETLGPLFQDLSQTISVFIPDDPIPLEADVTRVGQMLVNLLTNAAKYTERGGSISLTAERDGDEAVIAIKDTGIGISAEMLPHIFGLYTQVSDSLGRSQGGLGIGLTLVKSLAEMHGGSVCAFSEGPGKGTEFILRLPAARATARTEVKPETKPRDVQRALRVLVVDDNLDTARSMARLLKVMGHDVKMAHDGHSALALAGEFAPDSVLLDIGLPGMNGFEVAEVLRARVCSLHTILIAVSGSGQEEDRHRSRSSGFNHHLVKPVNYDELLDLLERGPS